MKTNQEFKNSALAALKGNWAPAVVATIIYMIIAIAVYMLTGIYDETTMTVNAALVLAGASVLISIFFSYPLSVGYYNAYKELALKGDNNCTANLFKSGFGKYFRNVWGMFLLGLFMFLWTLLFIIPGLIKAFAYILTPYILADYPELSANEAINLSRDMMKGHKFDCFCLGLSFFGWGLLAVLTLGVGMIWLMPYCYTAMAVFYQDVKAEYELKNSIN
jgi:uncharacterized membrane protein